MFTSTRSSKLKNYANESCETIKFESKKSGRLKTAFSNAVKKDSFENRETKLDLKKLRYDVIKLGTSGFAGSKKEESNVALAVSLGAKPPKNKFKNYKQMLMEKKMIKQHEIYSSKGNKSNIALKKAKLKQKKKPGNKREGTRLLHEYGKLHSKK